jgi:hypothetical protein
MMLAAIVSVPSDAEDDEVSVDFVQYDKDAGIISFSGRANSNMVNVQIRGENMTSPVTSEYVLQGLFTGEMWVGTLPFGDYVIEVSTGNSIFNDNFTVSDASELPIITEVTYDVSTGIVYFRGLSDKELVNVQVIGNGFRSQVTSSLVINGEFSDSMFIGQLIDGEYSILARSDAMDQKVFIVSSCDCLEDVRYDSSTGILCYSGKSSADLVNLRVRGDNLVSFVNAEIVNIGQFSGSMYVGEVPPGDYVLELWSNGVICSKTFRVNESQKQIMIQDLYIDYVNWCLTVEGTTECDVVEVLIDDTKRETVDVVEKKFISNLNISDLSCGDHKITIRNNLAESDSTFSIVPVDGIFTDRLGNVMTEYGKTLLEYSGTTEEYRFPTTVKNVSGNAFSKAKISKLIYDRDLEWDIVITNDTYPLQNCGINCLEIAEGVTVIPDYLFARLSITELTIPSSVEFIGVKSFYYCYNLSDIRFEDNNRLTKIGPYAFGGAERTMKASSNISYIYFGSSKDGYMCDIETGAFFLCDSLVKVQCNSGFYLRSIGNVAFAKLASRDAQAIEFNAENGILIPSTVEEIGWLAFSKVNGNLTSSGSKEPGLNTYSSLTPLRNNHDKLLNCSDWAISFQEGSKIYTINEYSFAGYEDVSLIDLSNCTDLTTIKYGAFMDCLFDGNLILSDHIEEMTQAFSLSGNSSGYLSIELPSSVKHCISSFINLSRTVSAEEDSELIEYVGSKTDVVTDLTNCDKLEKVWNSGNVKLLPGVYDLKDNSYDETMHVSAFDNQFVMNIDANVNIVSWNEIKAAKAVNCSADNIYIKEIGGVLYFFKDNRYIVLKNLGENNMHLRADAVLLDNSLDGDVIEIEMNEGTSISPAAFKNLPELKKIHLHFVPDNVAELVEALARSEAFPIIYVDGFVPESLVKELNRWAVVYQGYETVSGWVYLNSSVDGSVLCYTEDVDGSIKIATDLDLSIYILSTKGCIASLDNGVITVTSVESGTSVVFIDVVLNPIYKKYVTLTLDYNGGKGLDCKESGAVKVRMGSAFKDALLPEIRYDCHSLSGWTAADGTVIAEDYVIEGNLDLSAKWIQRSPGVFIDCSCADIFAGNSIFVDTIVQSGSSITLTCVPHDGYELLQWVLNGEELTSAEKPLDIENIEGDKYVSIIFRYVSPSSGLIAVSDRGLPTVAESGSLVEVSELGGPIDMSGMNWKGHDSVPLIVDGYIYFRAGDKIYKAESDTGYIVASAPSVDCEAFYHQIGYGDGVIVDSLTGKAYNLNLEQLFVLDRTFVGIDYYNGNFYSSGSFVYAFSSEDEAPGPDEVKNTRLIGKMDHAFSSYGFSNSVFVDHYMYRVYAEGALRGIVALDLDSQSGETATYAFRSMDYMYLDDGWISYNDGYIYLPGYTSGLFGAQAKIGYSGIAYVKVDGLTFHSETEGYHEFSGKTGFTSEMLFWNDKAYIVVHDTLYAFDIRNHVIDPTSVRTTGAVGGHGSIAMDTSHSNEVGSPVYIYQVPYFSTAVKSIGLIEDKGGVLTTVIVGGLPENYNSQTIRPDIDGRMVWYNDSGHIFTYTTPEKNIYYFFIDDGQNAGWHQAYGSNMYEAALALGDIITIDDTYEVSRMYGEQISNAMVTAIHSSVSSIMQYSWVTVDSFNNRSFDTDHYFIIIAGDANVQKGSVYTYWDGSAFKTYTFKENIGDRSLIGVQMVPGNSASMVQFFEGDEEIEDSYLIGIVGSDVLGDFPRVHKDGYLPVWKDSSGNEVTSLEGTKFVSGGTVYKLSWEKIHSYEISVTKTEVKDNTLKLEYTIETTDEFGLNIQVQAAYSDMTFVREPIEAKIAEDGKITLVYTNTGESAPVKALVTAYKGNILVLAEYIDLTESGSS